jgi:hypothetical protein
MVVYTLTVRLTHTTGTYIPHSLYTYLDYNDMVHDTLHTWMCDILLTQLSSVPLMKAPGVSLKCRPVQILGVDVCLIDSIRYPLDHQYTGFLQLS